MTSQTHFWRSPLDPQRVMRATITHWQRQWAVEREEQLAVEEPFEIRFHGQNQAVIMRTPGHDRELALGFLFSEGLISGLEDVRAMHEASDQDGLPLANVLDVFLRSSEELDRHRESLQRHFTISSSCGLCGKNSIEELFYSQLPLEPDNLRVPVSLLYQLPQRLREAQDVFQSTGGLHAAGLFRLNGELVHLREDVGRHNAVDKLIGRGLLDGDFPFRDRILQVSGRLSYEILQKALICRIPCIVAISAPSSLAVELADRSGITLVGFVRGERLNVYTHPERVQEA